ncbi:MAG: glycosyltransferase [Butyrivibrio sp.]|nr:glycosyltransferase [Butyrivibrio sp.]
MLFVNLNQGMGLHQAALADALYNILGKDFVFIEFGQKKNGQYGSFKNSSKGIDYYKDRPYILKMYESKENERLAKELISKADVVKTGGPLDLTYQRIKDNKLTFRSTEHIMKGPLWRDWLRILSINRKYNKVSMPNYRLLCQSANVAKEMQYCLSDWHEKCYKFAYFTKIPELNIDSIISTRSSDKIQIVWCARFINWKHPELPLKLAKKLIDSGRCNFEIQMIGADTTPLWQKIKNKVEKEHLENHVILTGGIPNIEVLERMRKSHIFIFTSDRGEGWGAVLNEAMGAGCACVASNEIGAVPFLLSHKQNGLIFKSGSVSSLFENLACLYDNPNLCAEYGRNAYSTITTDWSANVAAERLVKLSESILGGNEISFEDGPCAKAYPINTNKLLY